MAGVSAAASASTSWLADPRLATSQGRVDHRDWLIPEIAEAIGNGTTCGSLCASFERLGLPFAPVNKPGDLFHDPHLNASGGLLDLAHRRTAGT